MKRLSICIKQLCSASLHCLQISREKQLTKSQAYNDICHLNNQSTALNVNERD